MSQDRLNLLKSDIEARNAARQAKHQAERELHSKEQDLWDHLRRGAVPSYLSVGEQADNAALKERWVSAALQSFQAFRALPRNRHLSKLRSMATWSTKIPSASFDPSVNEEVPDLGDIWRYVNTDQHNGLQTDREAIEARNKRRRQVWEEAYAPKRKHEQVRR